jgi:flavin-dependent dehydrogenase
MSEDLVIGGGVAGAAAAILLAQAGRTVTLLERETGPHDKVCGEFLSHEAVEALGRLGVDPVALGAVPIRRLEIEGAGACDLPFKALSLSRRVLDEAMLQRAAACGATIRRGVKVTGLARETGGWTARTADGEAFTGRQAFLAVGKHDLKGRGRPPGRQNDLIGFKLRLPRGAAAPGVVSLHLFPGGYAGLEPVEGGQGNLCLVVRKAAFAEAGGSWAGLVAHMARFQPRLGEQLVGLSEARPLAVAAIPYGHVAVEDDGLWRLGDQAAVTPSFLGEGMAIALRSAELAASNAIAGLAPSTFQQILARQVAARIGLATTLSQALVRPQGQAFVRSALRLAPGLATAVARWSRLPDQAPHRLATIAH